MCDCGTRCLPDARKLTPGGLPPDMDGLLYGCFVVMRSAKSMGRQAGKFLKNTVPFQGSRIPASCKGLPGKIFMPYPGREEFYFAYRFFSSRLSIFPDGFFGSLSRMMIFFGHLNPAKRSLQ